MKRFFSSIVVTMICVALHAQGNVYHRGGINRGDPQQKRVCLVFTAADKADGADAIIGALHDAGVKGGFFFTGQFYEMFPEVIERLLAEGHYVGSHSYGHLLYCPWEDNDQLLVTREEFVADMEKSYAQLASFGITKQAAPFFIPPYEYYNETICQWSREMGLQVVNFTPGTGTNADYTYPAMKNYRSSEDILQKIRECEAADPHGLNGHFMLIHFGTVPERTDKFYDHLPELIAELRGKGYEFVGVEQMLGL